MNKVILMGRLTRDVVAKEGTGEKQYKMARYTLAVERKYKKSGEQSADFVNCVAYGKNAGFAEKWLKKGKKILVTGHIQVGMVTRFIIPI